MKIERKEVETYYDQTASLISDLKFYQDDLVFLKQLLDRYFEDMVKSENLDEIREGMIRFQNLGFKCTSLLKKLTTFRTDLTKFLEKPQKDMPTQIKTEYRSLEMEIERFALKFRNTKEEIFNMAEHVLELKKKQNVF